jgi:hypothetical protein
MNFKPKMVIWKDDDAIFVEPVCADRIFRIRYTVAMKKAGNDKNAQKLLRRSGER